MGFSDFLKSLNNSSSTIQISDSGHRGIIDYGSNKKDDEARHKN